MKSLDRRYVSPRIRLQPGKTSQVIEPFCVSPGNTFVLALRKSGGERGVNLDDAESNLRRAVEEGGGVVVDKYRHVGSGFYPYWVARAAALAKKHGATLLAESTDRLIRHPGYHSNDYPDAQARELELQELKRDANGVRLMTHLHPDTPPHEVRSYQRKRGQQEKSRKGGRPRRRDAGYKKRCYEVWFGRVLMLRKRGMSNTAIAKQIGVPRSTIGRWLQRHDMGRPIFCKHGD